MTHVLGSEPTSWQQQLNGQGSLYEFNESTSLEEFAERFELAGLLISFNISNRVYLSAYALPGKQTSCLRDSKPRKRRKHPEGKYVTLPEVNRGLKIDGKFVTGEAVCAYCQNNLVCTLTGETSLFKLNKTH